MTSRRDDATARLATLLDRLAAELLGAPDAEVEAALRETGRVRTAALQEIKVLLTPGTDAGALDKVAPVTGAGPGAVQTRGPINRH